MGDFLDKTVAEPQPVVVLNADIAGSTKLYEIHGDTAARDTVASCLALLTGVLERFGGHLVKTIGDEVMCTFGDPSRAVMAANEMQMAVRVGGEGDRFVTGPIRIKIGLHYGPGLIERGDVFGEAAILAAQLVGIAKPDQILTSGATLDALPPELRAGSRFLDRETTEGGTEELDVYELIWEVSGLTQVAGTKPPAPQVTHSRLELTYAGVCYRVDEERPLLTLGRVAGNDVVVPTDLTSRNHAEIEFRRGRFHLRDNSANGTMVVVDDGATESLRRDRLTLAGTGIICLGGAPEENADAVLRYACE